MTNESDTSKFLLKYVGSLNSENYKDLANIINMVLRHYKTGSSSCDFDGKIGTLPTRDEFCNMKLGETYMKNAMTCHHHHEKQPRGGKGGKMCGRKGNDETFWRVDKNGIAQAGTYCDLTQSFHWRSVAICKSCSECRNDKKDDHEDDFTYEEE